MAQPANHSVKRKYLELEEENDDINSNENYEEPPAKKPKHNNHNETNNNHNETKQNDNTTNGNTEYGLTKRQLKKQERFGFTQQERNSYKKQQRKQNKQKKNKKKVQAMTEEEKTKYYDEKMEKRKLKQQQKELYNKKLLEASKNGMKICIDLYFNKYFDKDMQYTNVIKQLCYCWNANKLAKYSASVHLLNVDKHWNKYFESQGIVHWKGINIHKNKDILDVFGNDKENLIYLTPDSDNILNENEFKTNKNENIYILGGLVDRIIQKNLTLNRAKELGIRHCKLPLDRLNDLEGRHCLNTNAVFKMLLRFQDEEESWETIFDQEVPNRNRQNTQKKRQRRKKLNNPCTENPCL